MSTNIGHEEAARELCNRVHHMRDDWAESSEPKKQELWRAVHSANEALWEAIQQRARDSAPEAGGDKEPTAILKESDWTSLEFIARSHGFKKRLDTFRAALLAASRGRGVRVVRIVTRYAADELAHLPPRQSLAIIEPAPEGTEPTAVAGEGGGG